MEKKKDLKFYKKIAKELRERMNVTEATAVVVVAEEDGVNILPAKTNTTKTFFHSVKLVDFCRFYGLNDWISVKDNMPMVRVY